MKSRKLLSIIVSLAAVALVAAYNGLAAHPSVPAPQESASALVSASSTTPAVTTTPLYHVDRVIDGDTLVVAMNGASTTVRLIGVDTPEVVDPRKPVQCFGREASNESKKALTGQWVSVVADPTQGTQDKYGRTLAYIVLRDGTNWDESLIENGFGREYTYDKPYEYQTEFKAAQLDAQTKQIGLWAPGACTKITP